MGLDMSLFRRKYIGKKQEDDSKTVYKTVKIYPKDHDDFSKLEQAELDNIANNDVYEIVTEVAYWRKFNALHKWFIDNCNDANDTCEEIYVHETDLMKVYELVKYLKDNLILDKDNGIIKNAKLAQEKLPTQDGFFFGSTAYDEYYYDNIIWTEKRLKEIVESKDFDNYEYYYEASW